MQEIENRDMGVAQSSSSSSSESSSIPNESKAEHKKPPNLNAFDIISFSAGFDLSGLFGEFSPKREERFTSRQPASVILSKLQEIANCFRLRVMKKDTGLLKLEGLKEGRKGILGIEAEIFEITPSFHLIELKKASGDTMEYQKTMKEDIRPALDDIVWVWQGEQHPQPR
ncbi:hypothetical protein NL676_005764 [Syzygium grande]|nr:hypothetical protein NL676_005764 [Syzygium grande]